MRSSPRATKRRSDEGAKGWASWRRTLLASWVGVLALSGCAAQRTVLVDSAADRHGNADAELEFWDDLATRRVVTNDDALHGLLVLAGAEPLPATWGARLAEAKARGWLAPDADPPKDQSAQVGVISVAVCQLLDVPGGLTMRLLGPSPRYCTRELVYLRLIPRRTEQQALSGLEFVDLVGRVGDRFEDG